MLFPKGMDANEYALKVGPAEKSLGLVLRQAEWMHKGKSEAQRRPSRATEPEPHVEQASRPRRPRPTPDAAGAEAIPP